MILYIKHIGIEGPGTAGDFFKEVIPEFQIVELQKGEVLPQDFSRLDAVICLGGPMNVYEEEKYFFLKGEDAFLKQVIEKEIPFLGLCLGSQLLAKAAGAKVGRSLLKEIGWYSIELTKEGLADPFFKGITAPVEVFQWHEDTFDLPNTASLLAVGQQGINQAFRVGSCAYGLQFHIEITGEDIHAWSEAYLKRDDPDTKILIRVMDGHYQKTKEHFNSQAQRIYRNFSEIIMEQRSRRSNGKIADRISTS